MISLQALAVVKPGIHLESMSIVEAMNEHGLSPGVFRRSNSKRSKSKQLRGVI